MLNVPSNGFNSWRLQRDSSGTDISNGVTQENPHKKGQQLVGLASPAPALSPAPGWTAPTAAHMGGGVARPPGAHTTPAGPDAWWPRTGWHQNLSPLGASWPWTNLKSSKKLPKGGGGFGCFHLRRAWFWDSLESHHSGTLGGVASQAPSVARPGLQGKPPAQAVSGLRLAPRPMGLHPAPHGVPTACPLPQALYF